MKNITRILIPMLLLTGCSKTLDVGERVIESPPVPISQTPPYYPAPLKEIGMEGKVVVEFIVTKYGATKNVAVIESSHELFSKEAVLAVKKWKYEPCIINGKPSDSRIRITLPFRLSEIRDF